MEEFYIHVKAPFAAYRYFQAGNYRATMPTMPHSAAYGFVLNILGIEMRTGLDKKTTSIKEITREYTFENEDCIPSLEIVIGDIEIAGKGSLYQQLHDYPPQPKEVQLTRAKGTKPRILPTRREMLISLDTIFGIRSNLPNLKQKIISGLNGEYNHTRYGLPFAGDNNLLFDSIEVLDSPNIPAHWYYPISADEIPETETVRLTVGIDRLDNSNTISPLFAITKEKSPSPPPNAWVWTPKEF